MLSMHSTQVTLLICILRTQFEGRYNIKCVIILRTVINLIYCMVVPCCNSYRNYIQLY